jgi:hypothetical protein
MGGTHHDETRANTPYEGLKPRNRICGVKGHINPTSSHNSHRANDQLSGSGCADNNGLGRRQPEAGQLKAELGSERTELAVAQRDIPGRYRQLIRPSRPSLQHEPKILSNERFSKRIIHEPPPHLIQGAA